MNQVQATLILIGLFALRCVAPILFTVGLGYIMNRLIDRWEAEETKELEASQREPIPLPAPTATEEGPSALQPLLAIPCWLWRGCDEEQRAKCPAFAQTGVRCWQARLQVEGILPPACPDCPRYIAAQAAAA